MVALDLVPELLEQAKPLLGEYPNVQLVEGDAAKLPFGIGEFDLVCERAVLHHVPRPGSWSRRWRRVTRRGGRLLVIDQLAPIDPLLAIELDRFERVRDPSHTRLLNDGDLRALFEANGLVLIRSRVEAHARELDPYLVAAARARSASARSPPRPPTPTRSRRAGISCIGSQGRGSGGSARVAP